MLGFMLRFITAIRWPTSLVYDTHAHTHLRENFFKFPLTNLIASEPSPTPSPLLPLPVPFLIQSFIWFSILFVISTIGNSTVLYLLTKRRLRGPLRIDVMLMHLAIADLMVTLLLMPMEIFWAWTVQWLSTDLMCRLMSFFRVFGLYLSSYVMVCISLDRWVRRSVECR